MMVLYCLLILFTFQLHSQVFIFDLSNTLLYFCDDEIAKNSSFKMEFLKYCFNTRQSIKTAYVTLEIKAYQSLEVLGSQVPSAEKPYACEKDMPYPQLFCDIMRGVYSEEEGLAIALSSLEIAYQRGLFCSVQEKTLVGEVIKIMFSSRILIQACKPHHDLINFIEKISKVKDASGKCKHRILILSNMQKEVYDAMKTHKPLEKLFTLVPRENWVISGDIKMIKPHKEIFSYVLEHFDLDPKNCIFIDDQPENIRMAESLGIRGVLCIKNRSQVIKHLNSLL